jgi:hypothetical protein
VSKPRIPNLFIIGAPKCGTTAMSHYLAGHPAIFMSEQAGVKEPRFFCRDCWNPGGRQIASWPEYLHLFRCAPPSTRYLGEATPRYLRSQRAVPDILDACPSPRFVVMLRNPVELAASQHNQKVKEGKEDADFETAWRLQEERMRGHRLPAGVSSGRMLQYAEVARLGEQMRRLLEIANRRQVHWIFYGDFKEDPAGAYKQLLAFLRLPPDEKAEFPRANPSVRFRWNGLEKNLERIRRARASLGLPGGLGIHAAINRFNRVPGRAPLRPAFKRELQAYFRDDVTLLSKLTGRDLSAWQADPSD